MINSLSKKARAVAERINSLRDFLEVQPVSVVYRAPPGEDPRFYGWWGDMDFGSHLLKVLTQRRQGAVEVIYHPPVAVAATRDRKALAAACETAVREGVAGVLAAGGGRAQG